MKSYSVVIAAIPIVILGVLLGIQVREVRRARGELDELRARMEEVVQLMNEQRTVISELEREKDSAATRADNLELINDMLRERNDKLSSEVKAKDAAIAKLSEESGTVVEGGADAVATEAVTTGGDASEQLGDYIAEMMKNPEMKEMIRQNQKTALDMLYGDIFDDLMLTDEEMEGFKDLLVEKQMAIMELGIPLMKGDMEEEEQKAIEEKLKEAQAKIDDEIKQLLGEARYEQFEDYNKNISDRMALGQYKSRLKTMGAEPLEKRQEEELLQVLKEEREKADYVADFADQSNLDMSRFTDENVNKYLAEREAMVGRVLERSETILTHEQLGAYKASMESLLKMERMQMEMAAKLLGGRSNVATTDDTGDGGGNEGPDADDGNTETPDEETVEEDPSGD
jgi:hypothetical protein